MVYETKRKLLTETGIMTLPIKARREWGLNKGDKLNCLLLGQHLIISPSIEGINNAKIRLET